MALVRPKQSGVPVPPDVRKLDETEYALLCSAGRDAWFHAVRGRNVILPVLSTSCADRAGGFPPALRANIVGSERREVVFPRHARGVMAAAVARAQAEGRAAVWLPLKLTAADDVHSNAVVVDVRGRTVTLFEPHGADAQDPRQEACGFRNFYASAQYFAAFRELVAHDLPGWRVVLPPEYQPPVFGQSVSGVLGPGRGDRWCALWTCVFLHWVGTRTRDDGGGGSGGVPAAARDFCDAVTAWHASGALSTTVKEWLRTRKQWMA